MKLSQSTSSPYRRYNKKISIQGPRLGNRTARHSPNDSVLRADAGRRTPTPIKIIDLSAQPVPLRTPNSLQQDYVRHFPLLHNRTAPLKQEKLRFLASGDGFKQQRGNTNITTDAAAKPNIFD